MTFEPKKKPIRNNSIIPRRGAKVIYESPRVVHLGELARGSGLCLGGSSVSDCNTGGEYFQLCTIGSGGLVLE